MGINGVTTCQNKIGLEVFSDDDMQFLKAYVEVMKPLALAMDKLQVNNSVILVTLYRLYVA